MVAVLICSDLVNNDKFIYLFRILGNGETEPTESFLTDC